MTAEAAGKQAPEMCGVALVECARAQAICATCGECGALFDNNVTYFSIAQKVGLHRRGRGHRKFAYWTSPPAAADSAERTAR